MTTRNRQLKTNRWGSIAVFELAPRTITGRATGSPALEVDQSRYEWRPSPEIAPLLPKDYCVSLIALSRNGTRRRFYPAESMSDFVRLAYLGGFAIVTTVANLDAEQRNYYNTMHLLHRHGAKIREKLIRSFDRTQDLFVDSAGRIDVDREDVLPDEIGLGASRKSKRLKRIGTLVKAGKQEAAAHSLRDPSDADFIRLGLLEAVRRIPSTCMVGPKRKLFPLCGLSFST